MSKDIRSFFTVLSKSTAVSPPAKKPARAIIIDSDDDDIVAPTPSPASKKVKGALKKATESSKLKTIDIGSVFNKAPIKQSEVVVKITPADEQQKVKKSKKRKENDAAVHNDPKFEATLNALDQDDDAFEDIVNQTIEMEKKGKKRSRSSSGDRKTPKKKRVIEHIDSGIDPGQEAHEKKRYMAMNYQNYLSRAPPKNQGQKEYPEGKPNCLSNLCFLKTGVLDSLDGTEFEIMVKKYGGRTVSAVSKKVNYLVVGEEAGPAKIEKADNYNIPKITEDEFLDLILTKSGMQAKYVRKDDSGEGSEDLDMDMGLNENKINKEKKEISSIKKNGSENLKKESTKKVGINGDTKTKEERAEKVEHTETLKSIKKVPVLESKLEENRSDGVEVSQSNIALVEKYKPTDLKGIYGQQSDTSNMNRLKSWLQNWHKNQTPEIKKRILRPSPWAKNDNGAFYKCALLSGPPGVGKTTTATLVSKALNLDIVEFNASDTRSKKLLKQEVSSLLTSNTITGFTQGTVVSKNRVLLMDEVDGMAGNEDRGGIQELIQLIKITQIPIICMCNDRNHQKMRSLVNHCFDLRFVPPRMEQLKGPMMTVCFRENINIKSESLGQIISQLGCDIRQILNYLSLMNKNDAISAEDAKDGAKNAKKDVVLGPWEVCRTVFTKSQHAGMSLADKARLFFFDYSIGPLFVQQNYLGVQPDGCNKVKTLFKAAAAADAISLGDIFSTKIRRSNNWGLLEHQAIYSSVLPGHYMSGEIVKQINFPGWLGKNSSRNKFSRMIGELQVHTRARCLASKRAIKLDYLRNFRDAIVDPLKTPENGGVETAVEFMKNYNLLREDVDNIMELCQWMSRSNDFNKIDSKVKAAFTREYKKRVGLLSFAPASGIQKKRAKMLESEALDGDEVQSSDEEEDISKNSMIKVKNTTKNQTKKKEPKTSKPSTSKPKAKGKKK